MCTKTYRIKSLALTKGQNTLIDLSLEFEGNRAFVVWDSVSLGQYQLKARVEIDPSLLQKAEDDASDFFYRGKLILPLPENN